MPRERIGVGLMLLLRAGHTQGFLRPSCCVRSLACSSSDGHWQRTARHRRLHRSEAEGSESADGETLEELPFGTGYHTPVMVREVCDALVTDPDGVYVDGTLGGGGHSAALVARLADHRGVVAAVDRDPEALATARARLQGAVDAGKFVTAASNFRHLGSLLTSPAGELHGIMPADGLGVHGLLLDLGVSSHQLDEGSRGFSYGNDGPLDMRMEGTVGGSTSAAEIVNEWAVDDLARLLRDFGEEPRAKLIAKRIAAARPMGTTAELKDVVCGSLPPGPVATKRKTLSRVFQGLRLAVNDEMGALETILAAATSFIRPGGHLVVLSYHSLEDRRVKRFMRSGDMSGKVQRDHYGNALSPWSPLRSVPKFPTAAEIDLNPRARSARLRAVERTEYGLSDSEGPSAVHRPAETKRRSKGQEPRNRGI